MVPKESKLKNNRTLASLVIGLTTTLTGCNWLFDITIDATVQGTETSSADAAAPAGESSFNASSSATSDGETSVDVSTDDSGKISGDTSTEPTGTTPAETFVPGGDTSEASSSDGVMTTSDTRTPATETTSSEPEPECGNGKTEAGESCDDHNLADFDGCSALCQVEDWSFVINGTLTPAFDPAITSYDVKLPLFVDALELDARVDGAEFAIGGQTLVDGVWRSTALPLGQSLVELDVVVDGDAVKTYELRVTRGQPVELYFKASNTGERDTFGESVALSGDGNTLAVGARWEDGSRSSDGTLTGSNDSAEDAGAVYVFSRDADGVWQQEAYLKGLSTNEYDRFGDSVALSADGNTLAVGASTESGGGFSVSNDPTVADTKPNSGAAFVFVRKDGQWRQQAYIKASNSGSGDSLGHSIALSADGDTLAVGAPAEAGSLGGVSEGRLTDNLTAMSGAVYVFVRGPSGAWAQEAYIKPDVPRYMDFFGQSVSLSGDGHTLAVGAHWADHVLEGQASEVGDAGVPSAIENAGVVYVFVRGTDSRWQQEARLEASNIGESYEFGFSVSLDGDGDTLAVGARWEDLDPPTESNPDADTKWAGGAAYVFTRQPDGWTESAQLRAHNAGNNHHFGHALSLDAAGQRLAVGAYRENGRATLISDGSNANNAGYETGAVYVFFREGDAWRQHRYVKAVNTGDFDYFGWSVAFSGDGNTLAIGAYNEEGEGTGLDANPNVNGAALAGAVYVVQ